MWQTGAELSKHVTFGEQAATATSRWRTKTRSGSYEKVMDFMNIIGKIDGKNDVGQSTRTTTTTTTTTTVYIYIYICICIYIYISIKKYNNFMGAIRINPRGTTLKNEVNTGFAGICLAYSSVGLSCIPAPRPMPSGHFIYFALPTTDDTHPAVRN